MQEPIEREEQQGSTETNERDEERTEQAGNEHGHERDQSARRIGDRAASTTDTRERVTQGKQAPGHGGRPPEPDRAGNFDYTCAPARQPAQQRLTRGENFTCAELAMTPVIGHSQPTQCAYIGLWRRAPPPRPPDEDAARNCAGFRPAVDAAVAGPRAGRVIERRATRGVRQRTIGVRAAGGSRPTTRYAPAPAARGGGWPPPESEPLGVESAGSMRCAWSAGAIVAAVGVGACATNADVCAMLFGGAEAASGRG